MRPSHDIRALLAAGTVILGPMAGVTEAPFRGICKRMGAALTYTEMVGAKSLHYGQNVRVTNNMLTLDPDEKPAVVQLYGADPEMMAAQAVAVVERLGPDVIALDVNMGCPKAKIANRGEGAALMRTPELAARIVEAMIAAVDIPVTVKFRSGWDAESINAVEFARRMEAAGAAAVAVHARTRAQGYKGAADWDVIAAVKDAVSVPVIGSGDVFSAQDAKAMVDRTGVDAVMIARGAQGDPWIFREARALIERGEVLDPPTAFERVDMAREHAAGLVAFSGERAYRRMRKHVGWYVTGLPGATFVRERAFRVESFQALDDLLVEYRQYLADREELHERRRTERAAARQEAQDAD